MSSVTIKPSLSYVDSKLLSYTQPSPNRSSENILFSVGVASGIGIISQLSEVSEYTSQIYSRVIDKVKDTSKRIAILRQKIKNIEESYPDVEQKVAEIKDIQDMFNEVLEPTKTFQNSDMMLQSIPRSDVVQDDFDAASSPPDFTALEEVTGEEKGKLYVMYSNPSFFKEATQKDKKKKVEKKNQHISPDTSSTSLLKNSPNTSNNNLNKESNKSLLSINNTSNDPFDLMKGMSPLDEEEISFDSLFGEDTSSKPKKQVSSSTSVSTATNATTVSSEQPSQPVSSGNPLLDAIKNSKRTNVLHSSSTPDSTTTTTIPSTSTSSTSPPSGNPLLDAIKNNNRSQILKSVSKPNESVSTATPSTPNPQADMFAAIRNFDRSKLRSVNNDTNDTSSITSPTTPSSTSIPNPHNDLLSAVKGFNRNQLRSVAQDTPKSEEKTPSTPSTPSNPQSDILSQVANFNRSTLRKVNIEEEKAKREKEKEEANSINNLMKDVMAKRFALLTAHEESSSDSSDESEWSE